MSSLALLGLAEEVIGIDSSLEMLRRAKKTEHIHYLASSAEEPPFSNGSFDLVAACGSIDWVVRARFLPRVWELLADGGWLVPLDFGNTGSSREIPSLEIWYNDVFLRAYPRPPSIDPMIGAEEAEHYGFSEPGARQICLPLFIQRAAV